MFSLLNRRRVRVPAKRRPLVRLETLEDRTVPTLFTSLTPTLPAGLNNNGHVATADFDGDGNLDLVLTNYGSGKDGILFGDDPGKQISILFGNGTGSYPTATHYATGAADDFVSFTAVGDLNGDGHADIVSVQTGATKAGSFGRMTVFLNTGIGTFVAQPSVFTGGQNATWVGIGDVNGDGVPDVVVTHMGEGSSNSITGDVISVLFGTNDGKGKGTGDFTLATTYTTGAFDFISTAGALVDINGDGKLDIVATIATAPLDETQAQGVGKLALLTNDGFGGFTLSGTYPPTGGPLPISVVAGDVNGDGKVDLVVANAGDPDNANLYQNFGKGTNVGVLLGDGFGNFGNAKTLTLGLTSAFAVALADLDLDGDLDIAAVSYGRPAVFTTPVDGALVVYRNTGSGSFVADANSPYTETSDGVQYLAIGDFNNKGNPDIVTVGDYNRVRTYLNSTRPTKTTVVSSLPEVTTGNPVTFTATVAITGGFAEQPTGSVSFFANSTLLGGANLALDGGSMKASFTTSSLPQGKYDITARFIGEYSTSPNIGASKSSAVSLTLTDAANTPPTIGLIDDKTVTSGGTLGPIGFTIGDSESPASVLTLSAKTSNASVIPLANISFGGSGENRTITIMAPAGVSGSSLITVTVTDPGGLSASESFTVTVTANTAPGISDIPDQKTTTGSSVGPVFFGIGDNESSPESLVVTATSSNAFIVPSANIQLGGTGAVRSIFISQVGAFPGTSTITVRVTDPGGLFAEDSFVVTVVAGANVASINSTTPDGTYITGQTVNLTLNFSESVTLSGGNLIATFDTGGTATIAPFSGTSAQAVYTILAGHTSPDLNVSSLALGGGATLVSTSGGAPVNLNLPAGNNLADNRNIVVNPPPATTVTSFIVNGGDTQRSRLTSITLNFNNPVNAADFASLGAITLTRTVATANGTVGTVVQTGAAGANGRILVSPAAGMVSSLTLTFDNANGSSVTPGVENGSLADGRWQIGIPSIGYSSTANDPALRRLFGDFDGNGTIDNADFSFFGGAFGQANNAFDFDQNGIIDSIDFAQFGNRYGMSL